MRFLFKTYTTVKRHYNNKYWIDNSIIKDIAIESESLQKAIERYAEIVGKECYIDISKNAVRKKSNLYIDDKNGNPKHIGYVFTGRTEIENVDDKSGNSEYKMVYLDLWTEIYKSVFA